MQDGDLTFVEAPIHGTRVDIRTTNFVTDHVRSVSYVETVYLLT